MSTDRMCVRCHGRAVYLGISGAAELVCYRGCAGKCPKCLSPEIEPFVVPPSPIDLQAWTPWGLMGLGPKVEPPTPAPRMHCLPCGSVWTEAKGLK